MPALRPWQFYDTAISLCPTCLVRVEAKIVLQDGCVFMLKRCRDHGLHKVLIADDIDYWRAARERFIKVGEMPQRFSTPVDHGCPYDCGLCGDHEQHSCVSVVELTDHCNMRCPVCYAGSGPDRKPHRPLADVIAMLDAVVAGEGEPDVVQLSGGEPTIHPDFFAILDAARERPIRHLMVNTNGVRLARDRAFAERLAAYSPGFELYLQFDSLRPEPLLALRAQDTREIHEKALAVCDELGIPVTLVCTLKKGLNDDECGAIIDFGLSRDCVRGVTFQPVQDAGRTEGYDHATDRLTLTEVRRRILAQTDVFQPADILPVPCHPDCIAMAYALKVGGKVAPLTSLVSLDVLLDGARSTISFERDEALREHVFSLFSTAHGLQDRADRLSDLLCCLPRIQAPSELGYDNLFRVIIMRFMDAWDFDVRSVKKSCVHMARPDGRLIPFDTYNLLYRGDLEQRVLGPLRRRGL